MSKKKVAPKPRKGLAGAAEPGGAEIAGRQPIDVNIRRFAVASPLRDTFAAAALAGLLANGDNSGSMSWYAREAYDHADAMMKERA